MSYTLPSSTYTATPRQARGRTLKTISEYEECNFGFKSDSEGDDSDRTIIARPAGLDAKLAAAARSRLSYETEPSPIDSSPCSTSSSIEDQLQNGMGRDSFAGSDVGTVFSEDSCPSLTGSNDTTFYTNSSRNSVSSELSSRSGRKNRFPSILIPRGSWTEANAIKEVTLAMSPAQKIMLSPQALSALPQNIPSLHAPPSFGDRSSVASSSPGMQAINSAPITPDMHNIVPTQGQSWGAGERTDIPIEIAVDEEHSIIISPRESMQGPERESVGYSTDWSELVVRFPAIPGATPVENTPIEANLDDLRGFRPQPSDHGVQLPTDALSLLKDITRSYSPDSISHQSGTSRAKTEMKQRSDMESRPRSACAMTPTLSDYSFSQLSIPSPGGFFSSLQANSRATWCLPGQSRVPSMPSSAVAENFYDIPFRRASQSIETILEIPDKELTDGPPTARQPGFEVPAEYRIDDEEDDDLYGAHVEPQPQRSLEMGFEYDMHYQQELDRVAGTNVDRTSDWLSAQTTYMSALRESNPLNDPSEYIPQTPHPLNDTTPETLEDSSEHKAVRFLEEAVKVCDDGTKPKVHNAVARSTEPIFLEAFQHWAAQKGHKDSFVQAGPRLDSINTSRLALPLRHVQMLLNTFSTDTLQGHSRPKYRGPFSQNPRATGNFHRTPEQQLFAEAERKQVAMTQILPAVWATEAQRRVFNQGQLLACPTAVERLAVRSDKARRVLDLAGAATGSWAWSVAQKWQHVKVFTVQAQTQAKLSKSWLASSGSGTDQVRPNLPSNHRVVVVPELWKLPFRDNFFDVVSARTLHMFLKARPIPDVPAINEWDLTLKECMRVLKPGGILDFIMLDSHIANNSSENRSKHSRDNSREGAASISPTAAYGQEASFNCTSPPPTATFAKSANLLNPAGFNFGRDLRKRGYEADGGCSKIADRLTQAGFTSVKRQWVGLPLGRVGGSHDNVVASYESFEAAPAPSAASTKSTLKSKVGSVSTHANGRSRTPFPPAPRPISEVSSISRIIEQYSNVEAVQGPVGSTADVSDLAGLLGTLMWEEWLVRLRLEQRSRSNEENSEKLDPTYEATSLLYGINDVLAAGYAKGACFRGVVGWARKPRPQRQATTPTLARPLSEMQEVPQPITIDTTQRQSSYHNRSVRLGQNEHVFGGLHSAIETPSTASTATPIASHYYGRHGRQQAPSRHLDMQTPIDGNGQLRLDTRGGDFGSPGQYFTESAVERGEVGTIPMMIVD